ncbi:hypothetical protein C1X30_30830, partial [Pseudomonas sp. FW305-BF6]
MNVHEGLGCAFISPAPRQCSNNSYMTSATLPCSSARFSKAKPFWYSQASSRSVGTWTSTWWWSWRSSAVMPAISCGT